MRTQLGLKVGDLVQARVGRNQSIILERKRLVDFEKSLEADLRASKADYEAGRYLGPFDTAEEVIKALNSPRVRRAPAMKVKKSASVRSVSKPRTRQK